MKSTVTWLDSQGKVYEYEVFVIGHEFERLPGNYMFARFVDQNNWAPVYIGDTHNLNYTLNKDIAFHPQIQCIQTAGATHIQAHVSTDRHRRQKEARDLINMWRPVCNK